MTEIFGLAALVMGLLGSPHCVAMCSAACAGVCRLEASSLWSEPFYRLVWFQLGRVLGYGLLGGVVAGSIEAMAWMTQHTQVLRPFWVMLHVAALLLGLWLIYKGEQPRMIEGWSFAWWRHLSHRIKKLGFHHPFLIGVLWALLPCGLLYSALFVASMTASFWQGLSMMMLFALGSSLGLFISSGYWLSHQKNRLNKKWPIRIAGILLVLISIGAISIGFHLPGGAFCY